MAAVPQGQPQPALPPDIQALGDQIRALKASLKARGMKAKDMKDHPQVAAMVAQLDSTKQARGINPKTNLRLGAQVPKAPKMEVQAAPTKALPPDVQPVTDKIFALKESLKARGMTKEQIKKNSQVASLQERVTEKMRLRADAQSGEMRINPRDPVAAQTPPRKAKAAPTTTPSKQVRPMPAQPTESPKSNKGVLPHSGSQVQQLRAPPSRAEWTEDGRSVKQPKPQSKVASSSRQQANSGQLDSCWAGAWECWSLLRAAVGMAGAEEKKRKTSPKVRADDDTKKRSEIANEARAAPPQQYRLATTQPAWMGSLVPAGSAGPLAYTNSSLVAASKRQSFSKSLGPAPVVMSAGYGPPAYGGSARLAVQVSGARPQAMPPAGYMPVQRRGG